MVRVKNFRKQTETVERNSGSFKYFKLEMLQYMKIITKLSYQNKKTRFKCAS